MRTLEDIITDMTVHSIENPTHGYNCACKDKWLGEARQLVSENSVLWKRNADYLLHTITRGYY